MEKDLMDMDIKDFSKDVYRVFRSRCNSFKLKSSKDVEPKDEDMTSGVSYLDGHQWKPIESLPIDKKEK